MEVAGSNSVDDASEDRTDPFLPAVKENAVVVTEDRVSRLVRLGIGRDAAVKWSLAGRRAPVSVRKLLPLVGEVLPWAEDLVLGETAYTARGFASTLAELVGDIPAHNLLTLVRDAHSFESRLFDRTGFAIRRFDSSRVFLADENATGLSGHTRFALRLYHLEDFVAAKRRPRFELVGGLARLAADELMRRREHNPRFTDNYGVLEAVFDGVAKEPASVPDALSRLELRLEVGSLSDVGLVRTNNEDALLVLASRMEGAGKGSALFAVADGMGGHQAGEVASALSLELLRLYSGIWTLAQPQEIEQAGGLDTMMRQQLALIGNEILEMGTAGSRLAGMGTTLTGCLFAFRGDLERGVPWGSLSGRVFNVGDSRTFIAGAGGCRPLSRDHSLVQELLDAGNISEEEAFSHPQRNIITRALGTEENVQADVFALALPLDAYLVMASDGLTDLVRPERLTEIAAGAELAQELAEKYLAEALAAGGTDNITLIVLRPHLKCSPCD